MVVCGVHFFQPLRTFMSKRALPQHGLNLLAAIGLLFSTTVAAQDLSISINGVDANYAVQSYSDSDRDAVFSVHDNGNSVTIDGDGWKSVELNYVGTSDTVLAFDYQSTVEGNRHGIGFDNNPFPTASKYFKLFGTEDFGLTEYENYELGNLTSYTIPYGELVDFRSYQYLVFMNVKGGNGTYSNIRIFEQGDDPTAPSVETVTVDGTTISWPNDGWYQVQDETTYSEVCAGGQSCSVAAGTYVVINHSTGERFRGIMVGEVDEVEGVSSVVVTGNTISWPDDGWYQVQDAATYAEVCSGGLSCSVVSGTYIVINHSTGERFRGITVGAVEANSSIVVTGNTISWPDDGWYQVQSSTDYTTVCNGGLSCVVEPGTYKVINHTTGEQFRGIEVGAAE
jgi:hypothetical protein